MGTSIDLFDLVPDRPGLPVPGRVRWQPLRIGLVELFHYDSEEFWFRDGHLLLRGNNGTGKSKVLSLTLPLLFDATLRPSQVEPDGDPGKKMAWNLLMNSHDRRIGYSWIEFGRLADDGLPRYLTLGVGLYAAAARSEVDAWFFVLDESPAGARIGQGLWLVNANRVVLTRERLREAIEGRGHVFDTAATYRRAVDERLFRLGAKRYDALMDTLIQLRQPQLSRKPNEAALSDALTEALPPLPTELLGDVAEALNQLDEDHRQLEEFQQLAQAVQRFDHRYRLYAGAQTRRQARALRQAQTNFDNASRERNEAHERLDQARAAEVEAEAAYAQADLATTGARARLETLQSDPTMQDGNRLSAAETDMEAREKASRKAEADHAQARGRLEREEAASREGAARLEKAGQGLDDARRVCAELAETVGVAAGLSGHPLASLAPPELPRMSDRDFKAAQTDLRTLIATRRDQVMVIRRRRSALEKAETVAAQKLDILREKREAAVAAALRRAEADAAFEDEGRALVEAWEVHFAGLRQLRCEAAAPLAALADWVAGAEGDNPARAALLAAQQDSSLRLASRQVELERQEAELRRERADLEAERDRLDAPLRRCPIPAGRAPASAGLVPRSGNSSISSTTWTCRPAPA